MSSLDFLDQTSLRLKRYDVIQHLDSSTTSEVFLVASKKSKRLYVLKQMLFSNMSEKDSMRVKREILVMKWVDHPNVVKFKESFAGSNSISIVMEYCECGTLEGLIEQQRCRRRPFAEDLLVEWMAELLCALAYIHSKGILHRDIKASNIFVTRKNHLKLGDFGESTPLTNDDGGSWGMIGTPLNFAPEVCEGAAYNERSDVWSLGVVFYEMCALRPPFEAFNLFSLLQQILTADVEPFWMGLSPHLEEIVREMLNKNPDHRPTAQGLINEHLMVPASHPSHPFQNPQMGRLTQQLYGPGPSYAKHRPHSREKTTGVPIHLRGSYELAASRY
ncbi:unnamed protein product [Phytomonas sp. Hart1]|nr:unnamed protein product [Phytomonas sp. Hart1]|eukprot:CCW67269.1 unnamed protein product [Phytomonas sp. isolate Hart1]